MLDIRGNDVAFDPSDGQIVYVADFLGGVFKSEDSGASWTRISEQSIRQIWIDPYESEHLICYAGSDGMYASHDGGYSWKLLVHGDLNPRWMEFGKTRNTVYLIRFSGGREILFKSEDGGSSWEVINKDLDFRKLTVFRGNVEELYCTTRDYDLTNIYRSVDGGHNWSPVNVKPYVEYKLVAVDPCDSDHLIAYCQSGMHTSYDRGLTWSLPGSNFPGVWLNYVQVSPLVEGMILVCTWDFNIMRTMNFGKTWEFTNFPKHESGGAPIEFSRFDPNIVYHSGNGCQLYRSDNGGMDWHVISPPDFPCPYFLKASPLEPGLILAGGYEGIIMRSTDWGETWEEVFNQHNIFLVIEDIEFVPNNPTVVYAGKSNWASNKVKLLKSTDSGATWNVVSELPTIYFRDMAISYTDPEVIYVSDGGKLLRSLNQGKDWEKFGIEWKVYNHCVTSPRHSSWVWAQGWFSSDYCETWRDINLPKTYPEVLYITNMIMGADDNPYIYFATKNDGLWTHFDDMAPRIELAGTYYQRSDLSIIFNAWTTDVSGLEDIVSVEILYEGTPTGLFLSDDGTCGDTIANDGLFTLEIPLDENCSALNVPFSIVATDKQGMSSGNWSTINVK